MNDGGIYRSTQRGKKGTWSFVGDGIANVEFFDHAVAATATNLVTGGTQDNGTVKYDGASTVWSELHDGDGATVDIDPTNAQILYAMQQYANSIARSESGKPFVNIAGGLPTGGKCFNLRYQVHPSTPTTMLASCESLWRTTTTQPPGNWQIIFTPPSGGIVRSAVDASVNLYYAGANNGRIYAGPGGANFQLVFTHPGSTSPTDIEVDPDDPATVYASFGCGYGTGNNGRVYRLRRSSASPPLLTERDITSDLAKKLCVRTLAVDRMHSNTVYVGTQKGVYRGYSSDQVHWAWTPYNNGLPNAVDVQDLEVHPTTGVLRAATWGRSAYEVNTDFPIGSVMGAEGRLTMLRVHNVGTGYGPPTDYLDVEVVVRLDSEPNKAFGFQLRADANEAAHQGMLDLLRDAFNHDRRVMVEYIRTGIHSGRIIRVIRTP